MDKYRRVDKPKADGDIKENDIRITTQGKMRNYISYATKLFQEKQATEVILKAMGRAINKTVTIAEIIKRRISGLHQITRIDSTDITDVWEPLEDGLDRVETVRHVSSIQITLSTKQLDATDIGYQPPLSADQIKPLATFEGTARPRVRGRGRGGFPRMNRGPPIQQGGPEHVDNGQQGGPGGEGQRPRRGGRGGGRGRGGYGLGVQHNQPQSPPLQQTSQPQHPQQNTQQLGHQQDHQGPPRGGFRGGRGFRGGMGMGLGRGGERGGGRGGRGRGRGGFRGGRGRGSVPPRQQDAGAPQQQ